jgi:hypothetical protein
VKKKKAPQTKPNDAKKNSKGKRARGAQMA